MLVLVHVVHFDILLAGLKDLHSSQLLFLGHVLLVVHVLELFPSHVTTVIIHREGIDCHSNGQGQYNHLHDWMGWEERKREGRGRGGEGRGGGERIKG